MTSKEGICLCLVKCSGGNSKLLLLPSEPPEDGVLRDMWTTEGMDLLCILGFACYIYASCLPHVQLTNDKYNITFCLTFSLMTCHLLQSWI